VNIASSVVCLAMSAINAGLAFHSFNVGIAVFAFGVVICANIDRINRQ